jgi:hypothetical protein
MEPATNRAAARSMALTGLWIAVVVVVLAPLGSWDTSWFWRWLATLVLVGVTFAPMIWLQRVTQAQVRLPARPLLAASLIAFAGGVLVAVAGVRGMALAGATAGIILVTFVAAAWWLARRPGRVTRGKDT